MDLDLDLDLDLVLNLDQGLNLDCDFGPQVIRRVGEECGYLK
jgi:hypothetical protein